MSKQHGIPGFASSSKAYRSFRVPSVIKAKVMGHATIPELMLLALERRRLIAVLKHAIMKRHLEAIRETKLGG